MPREKKVKVEKADLHVGLSGIIPSTQEAFNQKHGDEGITRKTEKESKLKFALELDVVLSREVGKGRAFPTSGQLQVTVIQFFASEKQCNSRDVDNMAKTVLDLLKGKVYKDDSQVMSLVVSKELISRVAQDFIYILPSKFLELPVQPRY